MEFIIITLLIVGATLWATYKKSTGSKPQSQSERDRQFLEMIRKETLDKKAPPPALNMNKKTEVVLPPINAAEKPAPPTTSVVPETPKAPEAPIKAEPSEPVKEPIQNVQPVSEYRRGTIGATVEEIMKKADNAGVTVSVSSADAVMHLTDKELISLTSLMLKRAITACEKGTEKSIEFSAHKSVSDVVLSCKYPDVKNAAIIESRAMLKFSAEKIKGVFISSDNGVISSEQAIIPFSSIKY